MTGLAAKLAETAARHGHRQAIVADDMALSWAETAELVFGLSAHLARTGIRPGERVVLLCSNRPSFLIIWFALADRGAVTVALNTGLVGEGLRYAVRQSGATALFVERALLDEKHKDLAPVLENREVIVFDGEADLFAAARGEVATAPRFCAAHDPLTILYTSGTTGRPKGVVGSHGAYLASGAQMARLMGVTAEDRFMVFLPLFHVNPQAYAVMSALETGAALVIRPKFSVGRFFDDARVFECTLFTYVGTVLSMLTSRIPGEVLDHGLRACVGGGAPVEVWRAVEARFGVMLHELYGMTEVGGWVSGNSHARRKVGSCGLVREDMEVAVVDEEDRPVPAGAAGQIVVRPRAPHVIMSGYHDDPDATMAACRNLWFHTGDAGAFDDDGYLYFHGRLSEIIRRGGENISPAEVEAALLDHAGIEDAAVVGVPDAIYGEAVKAVIVARAPFPPAEVRSFLRGRVPQFALPRYVEFAGRIERTETQKIQRRLIQGLGANVVDLDREGGGEGNG